MVFCTVCPPARPRLADHAGDQIDVDLIEVERVDPRHDLVDFLADVGAAVVAQNLVVEVFYA